MLLFSFRSEYSLIEAEMYSIIRFTNHIYLLVAFPLLVLINGYHKTKLVMYVIVGKISFVIQVRNNLYFKFSARDVKHWAPYMN